jgi:DNA-binding CsgD family transcriptional regulator/tetratricopeptide (TPR) repeat protein
MAGPPGFVGREGELSRLLGALGGDARLVLVVGDAGVGKTRFVAEGIARAETAGMVMLRGESLPLSGTLSLLPVADALGELGRRGGGALLAAALDAAPGYVRDEVGRLLPGLGPGGPAADGRDGEWSRERLFAGVAELLAVVARKSGSGVGLVIEDVHWADSATLDCLTFLARAGRRGDLRVVATCRGDEAPLAAHVAGWLAQVRSGAGVEEIRLGPLSRAEVAGQVMALAGGSVSPHVVDELFARAEGNPFFTEQLVAAALAGGGVGGLRVPAGLPARLAELLTARAGRCAGDARAVLAGLAVAGRPLTEAQVGQVTGLDTDAVREGLRELAAARLLAEAPVAEDAVSGGHRARHALLAEAVAGELLAGERALLHERTARVLAGDSGLAAEVAGHWQAAGRPAEELPARVAAAKAAERVFGHAQAAAHWQRAIELSQAQPDIAAVAAEPNLPRLYVRAIDALFRAGDGAQAGLVAAEAYRRFAQHSDPAIAAAVCHRAAVYRTSASPAAGLPLMEEALRLFEQAKPSADHAEALLDHAIFFVLYVDRRPRATVAALNRALEIAEAAGATALIPRILAVLAWCAFMDGQVEEGFATLERGQALAGKAQNGPALVWLALNESDALLKLARFERAAEVASRGFEAARQAGLEAWDLGTTLAANAAEALLAMGRTAEARALIDPLTAMPPGRDHWLAQVARAEIDLLRGEIGAAAERWRLIRAFPVVISRVDFAHESAQRAAEAALWTGRPGDALAETWRMLDLYRVPDLTILCGRLLIAGMRACADAADQARARRDEPAVAAAVAAADGLVAWVEQMGGAPFADHPLIATIPAERATWDAERIRVTGPSDPRAWGAAAGAWQILGCPHRAGYARWRQAQALLDSGQPATEALRSAAGAADGHCPLLDQIRTLADRARIPLQPPAPAASAIAPQAQAPAPYGLTNRELAVLRLLAAGRTNAQIGAELYISPKTAGVHVSNILRKLGVSGRVQAAALAERAGLLPTTYS